MAKAKKPQPETSATGEQENAKEIERKLREAKDDSAVKSAAKKEKQPVNPGDLSPIHNTHEVGTSGGDQRVRDSEEEGIKPDQ